MTMTAPSTQSPTQPIDPATLPSDPSVIFQEGLIGQPDWKRFVLIMEDEEQLPVGMLQSLDDPDCTMLVADPTMVDPSYTVNLNAEDRAALALDDQTQPVLYCTLSVSTDGVISANLLGPLAINPKARVGRQLVLTESSYSTAHTVAQVTPEEA